MPIYNPPPLILTDNQLTNGGIEIWQRGAGPFAAPPQYTADRWRTVQGFGHTLTVSREAVIKRDDSFYAAHLNLAAVGAFATETHLLQSLTVADGYSHLLGREVSLRVSVRTSIPPAFVNSGVSAYINDGITRLITQHPGDGAWHDIEVSLTVSVASAGIDVGIFIELVDGNEDVYVDNAMLVLGSPREYVGRHPEAELARCQRYYEVHGDTAGGQFPILVCWSGNNSTYGYGVSFNTRKGGVPTVTKNGAAWTVANCAQPTVQTPTPDGYFIRALANAAPARMFFFAGAVGDNVTAEWNP